MTTYSDPYKTYNGMKFTFDTDATMTTFLTNGTPAFTRKFIDC